MNIKSIILAAGKGSRMQSEKPKVMHKIGGKAMLHHVIDTCKKLNTDSIVVVVGHHAEAVIESVNDSNVSYVYQTEQLGTGHAVVQAIPEIGDDDIVLIAYGDVPLIRPETLEPLCDCIGEYDYALLTTKLENPTGYGRIVRDESNQVIEIVEEKDASDEARNINEVNTGIAAGKGKHLKRWLSMLTSDNAQNEYYLTDCVAHAVSEGASIASVVCKDPIEIQGVNNRQQQAELERGYQKRKADSLMLEGVTLFDPQRLDVRGVVTVGKDVSIDINAVFEGNVHLSDGVTVGPNCVIKDSRIGCNVNIKANSIIESADVGDACDIGPFARVRPGSVLKASSKIGNFVEIKKSVIGVGSKVSHLSYIGDTEMGANVNIGAGTITCNYDGVNKFKTIIGNDVFVGSDTQLIAPVHVKDGATIGAGSTISRDTPEKTLTLSRSKQVSVTGWRRPIKLTKDS